MLMTVLKGELATQQSKTLIRIFQSMKNYIVETQGLVTERQAIVINLLTAIGGQCIGEGR